MYTHLTYKVKLSTTILYCTVLYSTVPYFTASRNMFFITVYEYLVATVRYYLSAGTVIPVVSGIRIQD